MTKNKPILCMTAPVAIKAAEGESGGPPSFEVVAYTGGAMRLNGWAHPVVVDLAGMSFGNSLVANLDHDGSKRVGNVTATDIVDGQLKLGGIASAATDSAREVVESAANGFVWQASIEANPDVITEIASGKTVTANGQEFTGPLFLASKSTLKGFGFVSHGADDNTTVTIAATADSHSLETDMDPELKTWIEAMGFDVSKLDESQIEGLTANYAGLHPKKVSAGVGDLGKRMDEKKTEKERVDQITDIALKACDARPYEIDNIKQLAETAIEARWDVTKFRLELLEAGTPQGATVWSGRNRDNRLNTRVLEAAVCVAGRLDDVEKKYDDETLQAAHDRFPHGITLNQLVLLGAEANGYQSNHASKVTIEAQRAAFGMSTGPHIRAAGAFSTVSIPNVISNVANKFLRRGWDAVDMTPLRIASIRSVSDFKTITTVSLTGDLTFEKVGAGGEIPHGEASDLTYTNKADTYARMLAITRTDFINDDLGALTETPRKLGRGGALKLNNIFWTEFLNNSAFYTTARINENTAVADMTVGGLEATETIFLDQIDPDGQPLGVMPEIILVPTAIKSAANTLMNSELLIDGSSTGKQGNGNIFKDRFRVESSPYMSNTSYTGYSAAAWYMLADPNVMPVIEIVALNGRVEPVVETADADFNVLGVQMRGYSDVGVNSQEYRGGVRADGGAS